MKRLFIISTLIIHSVLSYSQGITEANVIVIIDEQLVVGSISNIRLIDKDKKELEMSYYPGKLFFGKPELNQVDFKKDSLILAFDYYVNSNNKQVVYNYELPCGEFWLKQDYLVLKIYNLNKREYRKRFDPLDKKRNYTFELIYPGGQISRVKDNSK